MSTPFLPSPVYPSPHLHSISTLNPGVDCCANNTSCNICEDSEWAHVRPFRFQQASFFHGPSSWIVCSWPSSQNTFRAIFGVFSLLMCIQVIYAIKSSSMTLANAVSSGGRRRRQTRPSTPDCSPCSNYSSPPFPPPPALRPPCSLVHCTVLLLRLFLLCHHGH